MSLHFVIAAVFVVAGLIFMAISAYGVIRFPDFFTRLHASGIGETLGAMLMTIGLMIMAGLHLLTLKILIVFIILLLTNPLGTNLIMMEAIHAWDYQRYNRKKHILDAPEADGEGNGEETEGGGANADADA
jgi:multicomponent Na+:H+ antiporter subunit G